MNSFGYGVGVTVKSTAIPWDDVLAQSADLIAQARASAKARKAGRPVDKDAVTWQALTDAINARFNTALSVQAVRYRLDTDAVPQRTGPAVNGLLHGPRYVLPKGRDAEGNFTDKQLLRALHTAAANLGRRPTREPMSIVEYETYREALADIEKEAFPTSVVVRRRFGTWNTALAKAGIAVNPHRRAYDGLTEADVELHLAHWLRWLGDQEPGATATSAKYRLWTKQPGNEGVPSVETLRRYGPWSALIQAAAVLEQSNRRLPKAKPVSAKGRVKDPLPTLQLGG